MAKLSLRKAAEQFDVSRPTLTKALKIGKLSGQRDERGAWLVDTAELARLYNPRMGLPGKGTGKFTDENRGLAASVATPEQAAELDELRSKLAEAEKRAAVAEALAEERAERIEDLRRMLPGPGEGGPAARRWWPFG